MQDTFICIEKLGKGGFIRRKNRESVIFWFFFANGISLSIFFKKKLLKMNKISEKREIM